MTTHIPAIDVTHDEPSLPNQHFSLWLRGQATLYVSQIVAILGFISFLASMVYYVAHLKEQREWFTPLTIKLVVDFAHIVFMAMFIVVLIQVLDDNERGSYRVELVYNRIFKSDKSNFKQALKKSKQQLKKFKLRFLVFWIGMLFLYVAFACQHSYELATSRPEEESVSIAEGSISFRTLSLDVKAPKSPKASLPSPQDAKKFFIFTRLGKLLNGNKQALKAQAVSSGFEDLDFPAAWRKVRFTFAVFAFNNITLLSIFWCFLVMYTSSDEKEEKKRKFLQWCSGLIVGALILSFPLFMFIKGSGRPSEWKAYSSIFDALSGVINAIALALLISRLDSKLIGLPSWLISILYSYAAVQPLFLVFELSQSEALEKISVFVLIFVFMSKIYFFLIIVYALQTGKMLNYLFCFPILRDRAKEYWGD